MTDEIDRGVARGVVAFVGAGPGDPTLRTEQASRRVAAADCVFDEEVAVDVLIDRAREGKRVVCLVAGDPLESRQTLAMALAVADAGVTLEVVPGIGARGAASAFAGVLGRAVRVPVCELGSALEGEPADEIVTVIVGAAMPSQRVVVSTAGLAALETRDVGVGDVILAFGPPDERLRWAERRPLFGKRILVTRAVEQAASAASLLRDCGADPLVVPTIEIHPPSDPIPLARALDSLRAGAYRWAAFTSANGVDRTWDALRAAGGDARGFGETRLAAIGPATARALERRGLHADLVAKEFRGESLADEILSAVAAEGGGRPAVLIARAARARDVLPDTLRAGGCLVDVVPAYETRAPKPSVVEGLRRELAAARVDAVTFTSSSTVDHLCDLLGSDARELLAGPRIASIGPVTTATAEKRGLRVDVTARDYTVPGLIEALLKSYSSKPTRPR